MAAIMIVLDLPLAGQFPYLTQVSKRMHIQNVLTKAPVESLDKAVLNRLARLDASMPDFMKTAKLPEGSADKFRPVVAADIFGIAAFGCDYLKAADDPRRRQAGINLDRQCLTVEIINNIERPKGPAIAQTVTHKINTPNFIWPDACRHRFSLKYCQTLFFAVFKLKRIFLVHPVNFLVVPFKVLPANRIEYLRKTTPGTFVYCKLDLFFNFRVIIAFWLIVKTASTDVSRITCCLNT